MGKALSATRGLAPGGLGTRQLISTLSKRGWWGGVPAKNWTACVLPGAFLWQVRAWYEISPSRHHKIPQLSSPGVYLGFLPVSCIIGFNKFFPFFFSWQALVQFHRQPPWPTRFGGPQLFETWSQTLVRPTETNMVASLVWDPTSYRILILEMAQGKKTHRVKTSENSSEESNLPRRFRRHPEILS